MREHVIYQERATENKQRKELRAKTRTVQHPTRTYRCLFDLAFKADELTSLFSTSLLL